MEEAVGQEGHRGEVVVCGFEYLLGMPLLNGLYVCTRWV